MPVQKQSLPIPLGSLDTKTDPKQTATGQMLVVENAYRLRRGEYRKRNGYDAPTLTGPSGTLSGVRLAGATLNGTVLFTDTGTFSQTTGTTYGTANSARGAGITDTSIRYEAFHCTKTTDVPRAGRIQAGDYAETSTHGFYALQVIEDTGFISNRVHIIDKATRALRQVVFPGTLSNNVEIRCVASNVSGLCYILARGTDRVRLVTVDSAGNLNTLYAVTGLTTPYISIAVGPTGNVYTLYSSGTATSVSWTMRGFSGNVSVLNQAQTLSIGVGDVYNGHGLAVDSVGLHLAWNVTNAGASTARTDHAVWNLAFTSTVLGTATVNSQSTVVYTGTFRVAIVIGSGGDGVFATFTSAAGYEDTYQGFRFAAGGAVAFQSELRGGGYRLASRGLAHDTMPDYGYVVLQRAAAWDAGANAHYVLAGFKLDAGFQTSAFALARLAAYEASTPGWNLITATETNALGVSDTCIKYAGAITLQQSAASLTSIVSNSDSFCLWTLFRYAGVSSVAAEDDVYFSGPTPMHFDGQWVTEFGFLHSPAPIRTITSGAGGPLGTGTYTYAFLYRWVDSNGNIHRSATYQTNITFGAGATNRVQMTFYPCAVSMKYEAAVDVFRTELNGSVLYYNSTVYSRTDGSSLFSSIFFDDQTTDATLRTRAPIYTSTGELDCESPLGGNAITFSGGRLFLTDGDTPSRVSFTREKRERFAPMGSATFYIDGATAGGPFKAIAALDGRYVLFKKNSVHAFTGRGPLFNGQQNDFSLVQDIPSLYGTDNPLSVVPSREGLMFQSQAGFKLLDRSLNVQDVGLPVARYAASPVTAAFFVPGTDIIRFHTYGGNAFVWDQVFREWSVWTGLSALSACIQGSTPLLVRTTGAVWTQTTGYSDAGANITARYVLALMQFPGIAGYQRIFRLLLLGERRGNHTLRVQAAYDYRPTYNELQTILADGTYGAAFTDASYYGTAVSTSTADGVYEIEVRPKVQRCESLMLLVEESSQTEGFTLSQVTAEVGVLPGSYRNRPARRTT